MPNPDGNPSKRAQKHAAASGSGAASGDSNSSAISVLLDPLVGKKNKNSTTVPAGASLSTLLTPTDANGNPLTKYQSATGPTLRNDPVPMYRPMLAPGIRDQVGKSMARCKLLPKDRTTGAGDPNPYVFVFHYNPSQVTVNSATDPTIKLTSEVDNLTRNLLATGGTITLTGLIDRQQEIWSGAKSRHPGPGNTKNFKDFGTLYDIEWLFRTFNGDPKAKSNRQITTLVPNQLNYGFLYPTTVQVWLNPTTRYYAYPVGIDIQHQLYTPTMVPMVTMFNLTMLIAAHGRGSRKDVVSNGAAVPTWAGNLNPNVANGGSG